MDGGSGSIDKLRLTLATPWTAGFQAFLSMEFSRQEYWSGLPFSSPGDLPDPGIKPRSPALQADSLLTKLCWKKILSRFNARYRMLGAGALRRPRGMVWGGRREGGSGRGTRVYLWWINLQLK